MSDIRTDEDDELLRREIDGEATPEERSTLQRRMAERPEVRARHDSLRRLVAELEQVGLVDVPAGFAESVLREARRGGSQASAGWPRALLAAFARRPALGYATSLAAGLLLGALSVGLPGAAPGKGSPVAGTALRGERLRAAAPLDRQAISAPGLEGEAVVRRTSDRVVAEVRITAGGPAEVTLEFDPNAFAALALEREPGPGLATLGPERLELAGVGPGTYRLILQPHGGASPPVRLSFQAAGGRVEKDLKSGG